MLQPERQHLDRIIDAGERQQPEHQRPDDALRTEAVAQNEARDENPTAQLVKIRLQKKCDRRQASP